MTTRQPNTSRVFFQPKSRRLSSLTHWVTTLSLLVLSALVLIPSQAIASTAWGSINNFDAVNDTGVICHGFEIEIDGIFSRDISYTYDWNHYGVPKITEDLSDPLMPKVFVRYSSPKNPDGTWAAYTDIPAAPILPTDGHQFTNPSVNFGGEHFGVGFMGAPAAVKYNWLKDDGTGNLVFAGAVYISTPTFTYFPPAPAVPAQVVPAIVLPPPPPEVPVLQFGPAMWVKDTKTSTHNNGKVELRDLVSDDPADPNDRNWMNGEPAEVETEWRVMQTEFAKPDGGKNGKLDGAPEDLQNGDEVITRRYDFFKYIGPIDAESGEAMADTVGAPDPDGIHYFGTGVVTYNDHIDPLTGEWVEVTVDLSTIWVVGDYVGAQMAGFDAAAQIGLIDHLQDGEINVPYVERTIVIGGTAPIITVRTGPIPAGMTFDEVTGILSGTPVESGTFTFDVHSTDAAGGDAVKTYSLTIAGVPVPPTNTVTTSSSPAIGGIASGGGTFDTGSLVTVLATANPGYAFVNWTEGGVEVSTSSSYPFTLSVDRTLVANFVQTFTVSTGASPAAGGSAIGDGTFNSGVNVTVTATANAGYSFVNWTEGGLEVSNTPSYTFPIGANRVLVANFARITFTVGTSASPPAGGTTSGGGVYNSGDPVTVVATPNPGYNFVSWTEGGSIVSLSASYGFAASANRGLVANFTAIGAPLFTLKSAIAVKSGGFTFVTAVIRNDGTGDALNVKVEGATFGVNSMLLVSPGMLGNIPVGGTGRIKLRFADALPGVYPLSVSVSFTGGASTTAPLSILVR